MPAPHHSVFFTGRMPFLPPNQQRQSTEGKQGWRTNVQQYSYPINTIFKYQYNVFLVLMCRWQFHPVTMALHTQLFHAKPSHSSDGCFTSMSFTGGGGKWLAYVIYRLLPLLFLFSFTFHNLPLISLSVSSPVSSLDGVREHGMVLPVVQWLGNAEAFTLVFISVIQVNSVLWHCWLGGRKGIRPVKNWVVGCWRGYLSGAMCRLAYGPADATATHCLLLQ